MQVARVLRGLHGKELDIGDRALLRACKLAKLAGRVKVQRDGGVDGGTHTRAKCA